MNRALDSCTPVVRAPGLTWPNRCSAFSFGERWRDSMSMMWRSSKTGFGTQSRSGIVTLRLSSGEASGMPAATGPMRVVIGRVDQGLPPRMCCRDAFVPCAITNGSAMPSQMASDPLGIVVYEWLSGTPPFQGAALELFGQHLHASPPSLREKIPELSLPIERVVMTALAKDPQQRFADMRTFAAALEQAYQGAQPTPPGISIVPTRLYQSLPPTVVDASQDQRAESTQIETPPGQLLLPTVVNT